MRSSEFQGSTRALGSFSPGRPYPSLWIKADIDRCVPASLSEVDFLQHLREDHPPKTVFQQLVRSRVVFPLGLLLGAFLAYFLISPLQ